MGRFAILNAWSGRPLRGVSVTLAALMALAPAASHAQTLARLHVRTFTLSADRYRPRIGEQLHLRIYAHVDDRIAQLDNVTLPDLAGFDVYGDERRCTPAQRGGTDCVEILLVAPKESGTRLIEPVTLDAVDARNGKPSRFATNTITLVVSGDPLVSVAPAMRLMRAILKAVLILIAVAAFVAFVVIALRAALRRRPPPRHMPLAPVVSVPVLSLDDRWARLRVLVAELSADPSRPRVVAVRDEMRRSVAAREEETFGDLAARRAWGDDRRLCEAMRAIEWAAFIEDERLHGAVAEALPALERLLSAGPARAGAAR